MFFILFSFKIHYVCLYVCLFCTWCFDVWIILWTNLRPYLLERVHCSMLGPLLDAWSIARCLVHCSMLGPLLDAWSIARCLVHCSMLGPLLRCLLGFCPWHCRPRSNRNEHGWKLFSIFPSISLLLTFLFLLLPQAAAECTTATVWAKTIRTPWTNTRAWACTRVTRTVRAVEWKKRNPSLESLD